MKKLLLTIIAVVSVVVMGVAMAACSKDVAGNTYVFDKISVSYDSSVADEDKLTDEDIDEMKEEYENLTIKFEKDGTVNYGGDIGYYKQDGDKVYMAGTKEEAEAGDPENAEILTVNGSKLEKVSSYEGTTIKIIYKKK